MSGGCCCSGNRSCCAPKPERRKVEIDFLYLDLTVCNRCVGTDASLEAAIADVSGILKAAGFDVVVNKVNITSKELAIEHQLVSSPTIRVNGRDIEPDVKESPCESCADLCGGDSDCSVDCRVWTHDGQEYTVPPRELIVNAILREVYSGAPSAPSASAAPDAAQGGSGEYRLPHNLETFFDLKDSGRQE